MIIKPFIRYFLFLLFLHIQLPGRSQPAFQEKEKNGYVKVQDQNGNLVLHINYASKCVIERVQIPGETPVSNDQGIFSSVKLKGEWFTTRSAIPTPAVRAVENGILIDGIYFGQKNNLIREKWIFHSYSDCIDWTIERKYPAALTLEDTGFPQWSFNNMETWTGALLGTGGVAWCKFFNKPNASFANHTGIVTLWNKDKRSGLRIYPVDQKQEQVAVRFSRQPDDKWTLHYTASKKAVTPKHGLSRFIVNRQDIWDSLEANGTVSVTYRLKAFDYGKDFYRGDFPGFNSESIGNVLNTIARVGVIDENIIGSNNWHLSAGFAVLHEQWIAQMGLGINDSNYLKNYKNTLDYYRNNAISADGRVKSRWAYVKGDEEPGTYDANGFYEAQWGRLLDSNTDQVINVAELFQMNGDFNWVRTHKLQCRKVLEFLLQRDSDNDGLIEAMTDSYKEKRGSDWIDVIWASYENAFLNAKMYYALTNWAEIERILGDDVRADQYLQLADKLKHRFNQSTEKGGFWDENNQWYVYWRDKDNRIHGNNLVTPVNFMAIAYGICDDSSRQKAILDKVETLMDKEKLFMWPINFFPFAEDEGLKVNYPFPNYENGDIFLGWGEVGIRAYKNYNPEIPVKYIRNVLKQYEKDGLAYQRYDRRKGEGLGSDILANNALPVVGLYRDIYGIQPKYNRLYINPRLTETLNGARIKYWLRHQYYTLLLSENNYTVSADSFSIHSAQDFGIEVKKDQLLYFCKDSSMASMKISRNKRSTVNLHIDQWDAGSRKWHVVAPGNTIKLSYQLSALEPGSNFSVFKNGKLLLKTRSDASGDIAFTSKAGSKEQTIEIKPSGL